MSQDCITDIDQLELPPSLERVGGGIRVAGHRVSLFHVVDAVLAGTPIERMGEMFPTVPPSKLEEVVSFCERHNDLMRGYHAEQRAAFAALAPSGMLEAVWEVGGVTARATAPFRAGSTSRGTRLRVGVR